MSQAPLLNQAPSASYTDAASSSAPLAPASPNAFSASFTDSPSPDPHKPIRTLPVTLCHIFAVVFDEIQIFLPLFNDSVRFPLFQSLLCLLFVVTFFFMRAEHIRLKKAGYLSRLTSNNHILWPLFIAVFGALSCTTIYAFLPRDQTVANLSEPHTLQLLVSLQNVALLTLLVRYAYACLKHNLGRSLPEILDMEEGDAQYLPSNSIAFDVNSINNKVNVPPSPSSLSRKQTHMITFLQDQVKSLSHEVLRLRAAAEFQGLVVDNKSSSKSGDMDHLLASKEQEMRAIAAERDKLRADSARLQERSEVLKKTVETMRDEREKNVAKIGDLQKDNDSLNKKYQKMKVLLEVEQEAMQHAQSTIQYYKGVAPAAPQ